MSEGRTTEYGYAEIVERNLPAIAELCRRFGVHRLDRFGSTATGRFDPAHSDLDFLVEFEPEAQGKSYFRLLEELEKLFGRKVDLLTDPGLENPYLRRRIEAERCTLFPIAMISSQAAAFLWDARRAAERITRFTASGSYDDYVDDDMFRSAVERQFEIIGEAFVGLRRIDLSRRATAGSAKGHRVSQCIDPRIRDDRSPDRLGRHSRRPAAAPDSTQSDARNGAASVAITLARQAAPWPL